MEIEEKKAHETVKQFYGDRSEQADDHAGYSDFGKIAMMGASQIIRQAAEKLPDAIRSRYFGCGLTVPMGIAGLNLLDLGSGAGHDCYIASQLVGENGFVTGLDMTQKQLRVANENIAAFTQQLGYAKPNMCFVQGEIEHLIEAGIAPNSVDVVISNCVINLVPDKRAVLSSVFSVLKEGGEFHFADIYMGRRPKPEVVNALLQALPEASCIGTAQYIFDFIRAAREVGFRDIRISTGKRYDVSGTPIEAVTGGVPFYSLTLRLFKMPTTAEAILEEPAEDYGQIATYLGNVPGSPSGCELDPLHSFVTNKPTPVDGNTASLLSHSWLSRFFRVQGDRSQHFGLASPAMWKPFHIPSSIPAVTFAQGGCYTPQKLVTSMFGASASSAASSSTPSPSVPAACGCGGSEPAAPAVSIASGCGCGAKSAAPAGCCGGNSFAYRKG